MNKQTIITIAKKEFFSFINTPLAYVVAVPFLLLSLFIYLQNTLVASDASMRSYFEMLPWFLVIIGPALSMRLISDEKKSGTLELLEGHPVSEIEIVAGKVGGVFGFFVLLMFLTISVPVSLFFVSRPDVGIFIAQYIGAFLTGGAFLAIGVFASTVVASSMGSFLLASALSFVFVLIGLPFVVLLLPWPVNQIANQLSILNHSDSIARGVLDIRDISYFATLILIFSSLSVFNLAKDRMGQGLSKKILFNRVIILCLMSVLVNVGLYFVPLRFDLTYNRLFTLSRGTRQTLTSLPDGVTIDLFTSHTLPGPMQQVAKEITDTLKDYERLGKKLKVETFYPDSDASAAAQAASIGVEAVTFNSIGTGKFEAQKGYLGIALSYKDKKEVLPFIQSTTDLEYQLTRRMRKLISDTPLRIGLYNNSSKDFSLLRTTLETQYQIDDREPLENQTPNETMLIAIDDGTLETTASGWLKHYVEQGGHVLLLVEGVNLNSQLLSVTKSASLISSFLPDFGVTLHNDLVYDQQLNETLTFNSSSTRYLLPYPFWLKALPKDTSVPAISGIKSVTLGWPSSLGLSPKEGLSEKTLLTTSRAAGKQENNFTIAPELLDALPPVLNQELPLAVLIEKGKGKLVVVGDTDLATEQFLRNNQDNMVFLSNAIDYLSSDDASSLVPAKRSGQSVFYFTHPFQILLFQYGNLLVPPLVTGAFGIYWLLRRKRLTKRIYTS